MEALSVRKKREFGILSGILANHVWTVGLVAIVAFCVGGCSNSYSVGGTVRGLAGSGLVLQNNVGDNLSISANGAFNFPTTVDSKTPYSITVMTQPSSLSQICAVSSGVGTVNDADVSNVVINCVTPPQSVTVDPSGKFAYAVNTAAKSISAYTIDSATGKLTFIGTVGTGTTPYSVTVVTVESSGKTFAYAANYNSNTISAYTIDSTTGALTAGTVVGAGSNPFSVTVDPTGSFAYTINMGDNTISVYKIDQDTGVLTAQSTVATGTYPTSITVDPTGSFAYVANNSSNTISVYTINQTTGALTPGTAVATGTNPFSVTVVTVELSGNKFAYAANYGSNNISVYTINSTTGELTAQATATAGSKPYSVTVDPTGKFAYGENVGDNTISVYTIDPTSGVLTAQATAETGTTPSSVTVDPSGQFAYVANYDSNTISFYTINSGTGELTPKGILWLYDGANPAAVTVYPFKPPEPGKFAYAINVGDKTISVCAINQTDGTLTAIETPVAIQ